MFTKINKEPQVRIIAHSRGYKSLQDLVTFQLRYPRLVHSELMTHRVFSRNASSSRAIPISKMIEQVRNDPAAPFVWTENKPGMQGIRVTDPEMIEKFDKEWLEAAASAVKHAKALDAMGAHKQVANRLLEPFQWISVVLTTTELDNWFDLRDHPDADPTIELLAKHMRKALENSTPRILENGEWHLPYVTPNEEATLPIELLVKISAARCARVSYLRHDGYMPTPEQDVALYERLVGSKPLHASPIEHQARFDLSSDGTMSGNFSSHWQQHRKFVERGIPVAA